MIINPSAHTMIPRGNTLRNRPYTRRPLAFSMPGGRLLWYGVTKVLLFSSVLLFVCSFLTIGAVERVNGEIEKATVIHQELVNANVLLRAQKARLFSSTEIGKIAGQELALYLPESGQYQKF
ncbi:MAG: hypothetical protein KKD01_10295 [Proteobacteria bacterium]|nr:hypothetical protein [Pseudomonadota bacterium]MBU1419145.1 hypothetical protein [Pseudomonadota bacterium]MBU1455103.1 hypothetical protein [Pseudomonadota bacterium]